MKTTIGGERLGSGGKQEVSLRNYERSTHDMGYLWRSTMSAGTLVPFMSEVGLPGDTFDIDLACEVMTLPTIGPLFGSYKVQCDVFVTPIRLFNGKLHMNMLNIGLDMSNVHLPQVELEADYIIGAGDNSQINASSIYSYLNIRGLGRRTNQGISPLRRQFNAIPLLSYWSIYKQYYANKQEERGFVVHSPMDDDGNYFVNTVNIVVNFGNNNLSRNVGQSLTVNSSNVVLQVNIDEVSYGEPDWDNMLMNIGGTQYKFTELWDDIYYLNTSIGTNNYVGMNYIGPQGVATWTWEQEQVPNVTPMELAPPILQEFNLDEIDDMRMDILEDVRNTGPFVIDENTRAPYGLGLKEGTEGYCKLSNQEGLGIKTYQSDLFNNWMSTEWIDGANGINEVTAVDTTGDSFSIDALNLANKVYNMLNRIAISGGTYDDWLDAVYTQERTKGTENPVYMGSLIKELAFEEVISTADTNIEQNQQPLGTLAGRGRLTSKNKGGKIKVKVNEPSYIMGIVSITPRVDYSQGNKWDTNLKTLNDFHKPALDEIGYQDLITDQLAWFDTGVDSGTGEVTFKSAGKQPAWINYMTNVNQIRGNFAEENNSMFMTLNRRYKHGVQGIEDLTTYIDPSLFNNIFAETSRDAQNFWVQISNKITARRKMSAKVIPNL